MHRAEGDNLCPGQLHHLQVVPVVEVKGLVPGHPYGKAPSGGVLSIKIRLHLCQRLCSPGNLDYAV